MTMAHTREFLSRVFEWREDAYCNLHYQVLLENGKLVWAGRAYKLIEDAVNYTSWLTSQDNIKGVFCCMSTQSQAETTKNTKGKDVLKAIRLANNAVSLKSIFIDVDVKDGSYTTRLEAFAALKQFITDAGLPVPTCVVGSGGGLHIHWVLEDALPRHEWLRLATALRDATEQHGLKTDVACTIDAARILRVPGTINKKPEYGVGRPVELLSMAKADIPNATMEAALAPWAGKVAVLDPNIGQLPFKISDRFKGVSDTAFSAGLEEVTATSVNIDAVARSCGFIRDALATGGASLKDQPQWFMATNITTFTDGGIVDAHRISSGSPYYNKDGTDELFARTDKTRRDRNMGWPTCKAVKSTGCTNCDTCPLFAQGKSPLNFPVGPPPAPKNAAKPVTAMDYIPAPYFVDVDDYLNATQINADTGQAFNIRVLPYKIIDAYVSDAPWTLCFTTSLKVGSISTVRLSLEAISARDMMPKALGIQGFLLNKLQAEVAKEFFMSWVQRLQQTNGGVISTSPFGWVVRNGKYEGFTYAGKTFTPGGSKVAAMADNTMLSAYTPCGDLAPWLRVSAIITDQNRPGLNAILAGSFAAPLVQFTGFDGLLLSAYSTASGIGKSTTMKLGAAVWSCPKRGVQQLDDTSNSAMGRVGTLVNLPLLWDEIKGEGSGDRFVKMVFQITQGREKSRMNADTTQRAMGVWQTMMVSASNESLMDPMIKQNKGSAAGVYRLFEYEVERGVAAKQSGIGDVTRAVSELLHNFGQAGLIYSQFLGEQHVRVRAEVSACFDRLEKATKCKTDERQWIATMACIVMGANYANELGLTGIDVPGLEAFLIGVMGNMRGVLSNSTSDMKDRLSISSLLAQFLGDKAGRHTLVTDRIHRTQGKPPAGSIKVITDTTRLDGIHVHVGKDDGFIRISKERLKVWATLNKHPIHLFCKALEVELSAKVINGRIGGGTDYVGATEYLYELDTSNPALKGIIE